MARLVLLFVALFSFTMLITCNQASAPEIEEVQVDGIGIVEITHWYNGYQAAFTPTLDTGLPSLYMTEIEWLKERDLFIDIEIVSASYDIRPERVAFMRDHLLPYGFGQFGHGHAHDHHDRLTYDEAYDSFRQNYLSIKSYGFNPVAYAYPYGAGRLISSRNALEDSGFLSGRLNQTVFEGYGPCIMANGESAPPDWMRLPALRMESYDFEQCGGDECINDPEEFFSHLEPCVEQGGWLLNTYHAIGFDGETDGRPVGWGFYRRADFYEEMERVAELRSEGKLWLAQMEEATLYARQRHAAEYSMERISDSAFIISINDQKDRDVFHMPLTLRLSVEEDLLGLDAVVYDYEDTEITSFILEDGILLNLVPLEEAYKLVIQ